MSKSEVKKDLGRVLRLNRYGILIYTKSNSTCVEFWLNLNCCARSKFGHPQWIFILRKIDFFNQFGYRVYNFYTKT